MSTRGAANNLVSSNDLAASRRSPVLARVASYKRRLFAVNTGDIGEKTELSRSLICGGSKAPFLHWIIR